MTDNPGRRALVIIPTFNEIENLRPVIERLQASVPSADILIIDDASPDGTGLAADRMAEGDDRISVIHRQGKLGLGSAYILGFRWGLERGYDLLIEMDADGSHPPETLPLMIDTAVGATQHADQLAPPAPAQPAPAQQAAAQPSPAQHTPGQPATAQPAEHLTAPSPTGPGLVIGSRWVPGGRVTNWPWRRIWLSRAANVYARLALGIAVRDSTAGYRVFRAGVLRDIRLDDVDSKGYCFQVDMTLRVLDAGHEVVEVPIEFVEREHGVSKMSRGIVVEAMRRVTVWGAQRKWRAMRRQRVRVVPAER